MAIHKADIIAELDAAQKDLQLKLTIQVKGGSMTKEEARKRYDSLARARSIVMRFYERVAEDITLTDELNKPEILKGMVEANPLVGDFIDALKLKVE